VTRAEVWYPSLGTSLVWVNIKYAVEGRASIDRWSLDDVFGINPNDEERGKKYLWRLTLVRIAKPLAYIESDIYASPSDRI
jgi:hypothetical protein